MTPSPQPRKRLRIRPLPIIALILAVWIIFGGIRPHFSTTPTGVHIGLVFWVPFLP